MTAPDKVLEFVQRFDRNIEAYRSGQYNETQIRREFIDPFFEQLGWDVANKQGYAEAYKDVIHEDAIKIGGATKAPDYCFRIGGVRKFFVESKKPSVDIKHDIHPAYQLRRYAWSAKLPLSILTDFEEFAVYDCRVKPSKNDKASKARTLYIHYRDYPDRWAEIADVFSREAILRGSFDKYADSTGRKRGTAEVDAVFLQEIESWRETLAHNFALRNRGLTRRDLNFAVQRTIDRIIFLRMCEDRGIEPYGRLQALRNSATVYVRLGELFRRADERYNSSLFYFTPEKGREPPDELTLGLKLDDKPLKEILGRLYYPESPYEFSVLPPEILGQVYEQFLGKVIRLTKGHQAKVEEKPEVKKAGGVYYTPTYIVDYIVKHTVGKLLEGKTPQEVGGLTANWKPAKKGRPLTVLDPACGSGSFLLGAYQYLLDWHRDWCVNDGPKKHTAGPKPRLYERAAGDWRLTTAERKRILTTHLFGVDIDPQAVEVTKLSLLLKVLEGESVQTLDHQLRLFHERALPDLASNIKCGNSLIGPDFYENRQMKMFDQEEVYRINAFDWHAEFKDIMQGGGFDAVIGNPPYVRQESVSDSKAYFSMNYHTYHGLADLYVYFYERSISLLRRGGFLGFITSSKFLQAGYAASLRHFLGTSARLHEILDYGDRQIFSGATTYPSVVIAEKTQPMEPRTFQYARATRQTGVAPEDIKAKAISVPLVAVAGQDWILASEAAHYILRRMNVESFTLESVAGPAQLGIKTSLNEAFVISFEQAKELFEQDPRSHDIVKPYVRGRDLTKWSAVFNGQFLVCSRVSLDINDYPAVQAHLRRHERKLRERYEVRRGDYAWWVIRQVAETAIFEKPKIVYPDLCSKPRFALNTDGMYPNNTVFCLPSDSLSLLSYLNSRLAWFWITHMCPANRGGAYRLFNQYMNRMPVHRSIRSHEPLHEAGARAVALQKKLLASKTTQDRIVFQRQLDATDRQIDQLVYELYGLTDDEIKIVEEATGS